MIDWHIGTHNDLIINEDTGLLFQWDDSVPHNIFEMSTAITSANECQFVGDSAYELGKVRSKIYNLNLTEDKALELLLTPSMGPVLTGCVVP